MSTNSKLTSRVTYLRIFNYTTEDTLAELEKHIRYGLVNPDDFIQAIIYYNANKGLPSDAPEKLLNNTEYYPLRFISRDGSEELWLSCVTAGYHGEGPHGTVKAMELMGFKLTDAQKDVIFTRKIVNLIYTK